MTERIRIDAGRAVDIEHVAAALGAAVSGSGTEVVVVDDQVQVTLEQLQAAVQAAPGDPRPVRQANAEQLRDQVADHLTALRAIRSSSGTLTAAQLSNTVRALAAGQSHIIRLLIGALGEVD